MEENVFFSFVLPAYKARFFKEAIESILQQTYTRFELIIVDDASPENLKETAGLYDDPRIRYYRNEQNIGGQNLVKNWNHAIAYAQGEFLILASDDDRYEKDFLFEMNRLIIQYPDIDIYKARTKKIDAAGAILEMDPRFSSFSSLIDFLYNRRKGMISCVPNYVFRTSVLKERGGFVDFPAAWHSDAATVDFMAQKGIACTDKVLFSFRSSDVSVSNQTNIQSVYDKLRATALYDEWFDSNIPLCPQDENEAFLVEQIRKQRRSDRAYMCSWILRPCSFFIAMQALMEIRRLHLLSRKQTLKLGLKYLFRRI